MHPVVSVITPLFNRAELVKATIQSVLDQTYPHWELIIVDDGSTDGSDAVAKAYAEQDERIKFHYRQREPKGAPTCRNIGIEKSSGEYVIFLDSDDILANFCVENRLKEFLNDPNRDFLAFPMQVFIDKIGDSDVLWNIKTDENDLLRFLRGDAVWHTTSPIWKKTSLLKIKYWNEESLDWQDWEIHTKALILGLNYKIFNAPVDCYIRRGTSNDNIYKQAYSREKILKRSLIFLEIACLLNKYFIQRKDYKKALASQFYRFAFSASFKNVFDLGDLKEYYENFKRSRLISSPLLYWSYVYVSILLIVYKNNFFFKSLIYYLNSYVIPGYLRNVKNLKFKVSKARDKAFAFGN